MNTIMKRTLEERINNFCNRETKALADITFRYETACATTEVCFEERIYNSYACKMKFKSVLDGINAEIKEIRLMAETGEIPREIHIEYMDLFMKMKAKVQKSRKDYVGRMETLEERMKKFKDESAIKVVTSAGFMGINEKLLDGYLRDKVNLSEQRITETYDRIEIEINHLIDEVNKMAEIFLVPANVLSSKLEQFQEVKNSLTKSMEKYMDAFKALEQELVAK